MLKIIRKSSKFRNCPNFRKICDIFAKLIFVLKFKIECLHAHFRCTRIFIKFLFQDKKTTAIAILQFSPVPAYFCCGQVKSPVCVKSEDVHSAQTFLIKNFVWHEHFLYLKFFGPKNTNITKNISGHVRLNFFDIKF